MGDLPGHSVAITSMFHKKLERIAEIGVRGKRNFENEFLEMVFQLLEEMIIYYRNWSIEVLEKLRLFFALTACFSKKYTRNLTTTLAEIAFSMY